MKRLTVGQTGVVAGTVLLSAASVVAAPAARANGIAAVTCAYVVQAAWRGGFSADVSIHNNGPAINGWTLRWTFPQPTTVLDTWSSTLSETGDGEATATNVSYNAAIATGQVLSFGWVAASLSTDAPTDLTINGVPC